MERLLYCTNGHVFVEVALARGEVAKPRAATVDGATAPLDGRAGGSCAVRVGATCGAVAACANTDRVERISDIEKLWKNTHT